MPAYTLCCFVDRLAPKASLTLVEARIRAFYVAEGAAKLASNASAAALAANSAAYVRAPLTITSAAGAVVLRWELVPEDAAGERPSGDGVESQEALAAALHLSGDFLLRCDRVDFPPGGIAYLHTHQGPGIRCLLKGTIEIQTEGHTATYERYGAWFESGPAPVLALASKQDDTAFARLMLLPTALQGKSSISYVNEEDRAKPKPQSYQVFLDEVVH